MFSRILIASDLSEASDRVVRQAAELVGVGAREAVLVHFLEPPGWYVSSQQEARVAAEELLQRQCAVLSAAGFDVTLHVTGGLPELEIKRAATQLAAKLIVIGSHGHNLLADLALGGTASAVLHQSSLAVLLIRLASSGEAGPAPGEQCVFSHVLFATDFSDNSEQAFAYVQEIVRQTRCRVTLLHVQDRLRLERYLADRLEEFNRIDMARLDRMKDQLCEYAGSSVSVALPYGSPVQEILHCAEQQQASLVVMGSQGRGFLGEAFLGSVSHKVARHGRSHVLLIPPAGAK